MVMWYYGFSELWFCEILYSLYIILACQTLLNVFSSSKEITAVKVLLLTLITSSSIRLSNCVELLWFGPEGALFQSNFRHGMSLQSVYK